jgi:hypothetical protein
MEARQEMETAQWEQLEQKLRSAVDARGTQMYELFQKMVGAVAMEEFRGASEALRRLLEETVDRKMRQLDLDGLRKQLGEAWLEEIWGKIEERLDRKLAEQAAAEGPAKASPGRAGTSEVDRRIKQYFDQYVSSRPLSERITALARAEARLIGSELCANLQQKLEKQMETVYQENIDDLLRSQAFQERIAGAVRAHLPQPADAVSAAAPDEGLRSELAEFRERVEALSQRMAEAPSAAAPGTPPPDDRELSERIRTVVREELLQLKQDLERSMAGAPSGAPSKQQLRSVIAQEIERALSDLGSGLVGKSALKEKPAPRAMSAQ